MQIIVYSPTEIMCLQVESSDTILDVKAKIQIKQGFPPDIQLLSYGDKPLRDGRTLAEYGIEDGSNLRVAYRLGAGTMNKIKTIEIDIEPYWFYFLLMAYYFSKQPVNEKTAKDYRIEGAAACERWCN